MLRHTGAGGVGVPVAEGGEAHGGRHECHGCGEGGGATQEQGKHAGDTHGKELGGEDRQMGDGYESWSVWTSSTQ